MAKLGRQGCQVRKVEKSLDGSGYYSSVPRCPSCFMGGGFATEQRKLKVVSRAGARAVGYNEQRNTALNEQRAIPIRDFKSHRDYGIHAAAQRGKSSQIGSCPGAPGHHILHFSNGGESR